MFIWNVRGLNSKARRDAVRQMIADIRPGVICLQETKVQNPSIRLLLSTLGTELDKHVALPAEGIDRKSVV